MNRMLTLAFLLCLSLVRGVPAQEVHPLERLLHLIESRLELAQPVARAKWNSRGAIEDKPREQQILRDLAELAPGYGLEPREVEAFFRAQIEASKMVQHALVDKWTAQAAPPFEAVADLGRDIRPQLDRLTPQLLQALHDSQPFLGSLAARGQAEQMWGGQLDSARLEALRPLLQGRPGGWFGGK